MKTLVLQDIVLNQVRRERTEVSAVFCTGERVVGTVRGFDQFTIIFDTANGGQVLAYKHNVAGIFLNKAVLTDGREE